MKLIPFLFLLIISACTHFKKKQISAQESWKGHSTNELKNHSYFQNLPIKKKINNDDTQTWLLRDRSKYQSKAYCQSLGGCMGLQAYNCDNIFTVKDEIILSFEQKGSCPGPKTIERP